LFQRRRKYNVPVHICAHPELNKYIRRVVDDVKPMLEANQVDHIAIVIKNKENIPVERFVFKTQKGTANDICSKRFSETLERDLRTLLLKLSGSDSLLSDNPPDSTFSVEVCTSDTAAASATVAMEQGHQDFPWVVENELDMEECSEGSWNIVPLKSLSNHFIKVSLLAKECKSNKTY
jgi:mitotic spindle assembly checkpoint protein MAD2B